MAQRSFVLPHVLEKSGAISGIMWDASGGQVGHVVKLDKPVTVVSPVVGLFSLYGNDGMFAWMSENLNGTHSPDTFNLFSTEKGMRNLVVLDGATPAFVEFPACDVDSKEPQGIRMGIGATSTGDRSPFDGTSYKPIAKKQKMWLPSNFRLTLGKLPTTRVSKIDALVIKQKSVGDPVGTSVYEAEEFSFTVPMADSEPFIIAAKNASRGTPNDFDFRQEFLDEDGNVLLTLTGVLTISSADADNVCVDPADPSAMLRVRGHHRGHVTVLK